MYFMFAKYNQILVKDGKINFVYLPVFNAPLGGHPIAILQRC